MGKPKQHKSRQKQKKLEQKRQKLPKLKFRLTFDDHYFKTEFLSALKKVGVEEFSKTFWRDIPINVRRRVLDHYRHIKRLSNENVSYFLRDSADFVWELFRKTITAQLPKLSALNYSIEVLSDKMLHFDVYLSTLEVRSTPYGKVYMLPDVRFPPNKRVGVSTHALQRMDHRLLMRVMHVRAIALRSPMVLLPYRDDTYSLYLALPEKVKVNGKACQTYILMGYFPIVAYGDLLVGKTILKPGFDGTPEVGMADTELADHRVLTVINGVVHRILCGKAANLQGVPYNLSINPNLSMLCNIGKILA